MAYEIALIDDHRLSISTISFFVKTNFPEASIKRYYHPTDFLDEYRSNEPDLIITDLNMPDVSGIELIKKVRDHDPNQKVMVLSMYYNDQLMAELLKLKVNGYVSKNWPPERLIEIISRVIDSDSVDLENQQVEFTKSETRRSRLLTPRELQVIKYSAQGKTASEIGKELFVSQDTIKTHIRNIIAKTGLKNFKEVISHYENKGWKVLS